MKKLETKKIKSIDYHRNGTSGESFHVVLFSDAIDSGENMMAVVFDDPGHVAVFDVDNLGRGDIEFGLNSWRGDHFEEWLRKAIDKFESSGRKI